jgi:hypothetical protein
MAKFKQRKPVLHNSKAVEKKAPHVFIECFAYANGFMAQNVQSLFANVFDCNANGVTTSIDIRSGCPYVMKERNISVGRFWASEADYLLFVDADISFEADAIRRIVQVAEKRELDIVGGLYRYKMQQEAYPMQLYCTPEGEYCIDEDGLSPAAGLPTGFMLISRNAIKILIEAYPETQFTVKDSRDGKELMVLYDLFDCMLYNGEWWGEDYVFCRRWTALKKPLFAFTDVALTHIGQEEFTGNFKDFYMENYLTIREKNLQILAEGKQQTLSAAA